MRLRNFLIYGLIALIFLAMGGSASAQIARSVGTTSDCDVRIGPDLSTDPLNQEIAKPNPDGGSVIFGLALPELRGDLVINFKDVTLKGGFSSCREASQSGLVDTPVDRGSKTIIRGSGRGSVIRINGGEVQLAPTNDEEWNVSPRKVLFDNLIIRGGARTAAGGGLNVTGNIALLIFESEIVDNRAEQGAGLFINGPLAKAELYNTQVAHNHAEIEGGGLSCSNQANILFQGNKAIEQNEAGELGGGVLAFNCRLDLQADVLNNRAGGQGGGLMGLSHATIDIFGAGRAVRIDGNRVDFDSDEESMGGGIYLADRHTAMTAENVQISNNHAGSHGGGLAVVERAHAVIRRANDRPCTAVDCNLIEGNRAGTEAGNAEGAAAYVSDGAILDILQTRVRHHDAGGVKSLFFATRAAARLRIESSIVHTNRMDERADYVFKAVNRGEITVALSSVTDNHYRVAAMLGANSGVTSLYGNALLGTQGTQWLQLDNAASPGVTANIFHHNLIPPEGGLDRLGRFTQSDNRIFIDPRSKNFRLKDDSETGLLIRNQLSGTEYTPLSDEDYDGTDRSAGSGDNAMYDIGPDQYSLGNETPPPVVHFSGQIDSIFQSPRCLNCHAALEVPEVINQHFNHPPLTCENGGCHAGLGENVDLSSWHAPKNMHLHLLTPRQRCNLAKRDVVPGVLSGKDHLIHDPLIIWAVSEGAVPNGGNSNGQKPPASRLSNAAWISLVESWFRSGARCD